MQLAEPEAQLADFGLVREVFKMRNVYRAGVFDCNFCRFMHLNIHSVKAKLVKYNFMGNGFPPQFLININRKRNNKRLLELNRPLSYFVRRKYMYIWVMQNIQPGHLTLTVNISQCSALCLISKLWSC